MTIEYKDSKRIVGLSTDTVETLSFEDDSFSSGWTQAGTTIVATGGQAVITAVPRNAEHRIYKSLGLTVDNTKFILDFKINISAMTSQWGGIWVGLTDDTTWVGSNSNDFLGFNIHDNSGGTTGKMRTTYSNEGTKNVAGNSTTTISFNTDYYVRVIRTSATNTDCYVYSDSARTTLVEKLPSLTTLPSGVDGLTHIQVTSDNGGISATVTGVVDDIKLWSGVTSLTSKPTDVQDNSIFVETDTAKRYWGVGGSGVSTTGLKAYYDFDESSGNLINQSTTGDGLGSNANGIASGDPTYSVTGKVAEAISFDGVGDKFTLGTTAGQWNFLHNGGGFSISWWLKLNATTNETQGICGTGGGGSSIGFELRVNPSTGVLNALIENGSGSTASITSSSGFVPVNTTTWYHYVLTFTSGTWNIYRDGGNNSNASSSITWSSSNHSRNMELANANANTPTDIKDLTGELDEMSIWSRVITSSEITTLYNSNNGKRVTGLWTRQLPTPIVDDNFSSDNYTHLNSNTSVSGGKLLYAQSSADNRAYRSITEVQSTFVIEWETVLGTASSGHRYYSLVLSEESTNVKTTSSNDGYAIVIDGKSGSVSSVYIQEIYSGTVNQSSASNGSIIEGLSQSAIHYFTFSRSGNVLTVESFSDSARTVSEGSGSLTLASTSSGFVFLQHGTENPSTTVSGVTIDNLKFYNGVSDLT